MKRTLTHPAGFGARIRQLNPTASSRATTAHQRFKVSWGFTLHADVHFNSRTITLRSHTASPWSVSMMCA